MNNNASLQERTNTQMSSGAAVFILNTLNGREYSIIETDGKKYVLWNKNENEIGKLGGRQTYDGFVQSIEGNNPNMEMAMDFRINHLREANPLFTNASNFEIACFYYANAQEIDRNRCLEAANAIGNETLSSTVTSVAQEVFDKYKIGSSFSIR